MKTIFSIILVSISILIENTAAQSKYAQRAELFDSHGVSIPINTYEPDLIRRNFDDRAVSICVTGVWLIYEHPNYNTERLGVMEFVFGAQNTSNPYCVQFRNIRIKASSIRHAGSLPDYRSDTITLYQKDYFQGYEEYTFQDLPHLNLHNDHSSLIITGSSSWTLYDLPNYLGSARCVSPPKSEPYKPALIHDLKNIGIPHNSIKSIRKGCL